MEDNIYYVYRHIRLDTNTPFYVGKGKEGRANSKRRNKYWQHIADKAGFEVEIFLENLTEEQAFEKEREFIKLYRDCCYKLANLTDGGEGPSGFKHPEDVKKRMSEFHKERFRNGAIPNMKDKKGVHYSPATEFKKGSIPHNKGQKMPTDWINPASRKIIDQEGIIWPTLKSFCLVYGGCSPNLIRAIKKNRPYKGISIKYYEEPQEAQVG